MVSLIWIPKHSEPSDAESWQREIERVFGDGPGGRVELEQQGQAWRAVFWAFVAAAGPNVALYRQAAVLVGLVALFAQLRSPSLALLLATFLALGVGMSRLFFGTVLV
jgi:hypothetical protein